MQYDTAQYVTLQCMQGSKIKRSFVTYLTVQYNSVQCSTYSTVQYNTVNCSVVQYTVVLWFYLWDILAQLPPSLL